MAEKITIALQCSDCGHRNYYFKKVKKKEYKLELNKFCKTCRKYTTHKEVKV